MKRRLPQVLTGCLLLLLMLIHQPACYAVQYSANWLNVTLDECTGQIQVEFVWYVDVDGNNNDDLWQDGSLLEMKIGTGNWFSLAEMGSDKKNGAYIGTGGNNDHFYFLVKSDYIVGKRHYSTGTSSTHRPTWLVATINLKEVCLGKDVSFRLNGTWEGGGSYPAVQTKSFKHTNDLSSIQTTNNTMCDQVKITWDVPTGLCSGSYAYVYRDNTYIGNTGAINKVYHDYNAVPGQTYAYKVKFGRYMAGNFWNYGASSSEMNGRRQSKPSVPVNILASDDNCEQTVDLTWNLGTEASNYYIYRGSDQIAALSGTSNSFKDYVPEKGMIYQYRIAAGNSCGMSDKSVSTAGGSMADLLPVNQVNTETTDDGKIKISWSDSNNEDSYKVERRILGGTGSAFFEVAVNTTDYVDENVTPCQTYEYRLWSVNQCVPTGVVSPSVSRIRIAPDLSETFADNSIKASNGFYPDRVELTWSAEKNANLLSGYRVSRMRLDNPNDTVLIATLNSGNNLYVDNLTEAGVLYEYFIVGESQCENETIKTNMVSAIGFRNSVGTLSGNVTYDGGVAVGDVRIGVQSTMQGSGSSVALTADDYLEISAQSSVFADNAFLLECWFQPATQTKSYTLIKKDNVFTMGYAHETDELFFDVTNHLGHKVSVSIPGMLVVPFNFYHIAAKYDKDSLYLYLNGVRKQAVACQGFNLAVNNQSITLGEGFEGYIDDVRVWNIKRTDYQIYRDYSRLLVGKELGLAVYLPMDEGVGNIAYDISKTGSGYNRNNGIFRGGAAFSEQIPSPNQFGIAGYTDEDGNYLITVPYNGNGETFTVTPSLKIHQFAPSTRALYIGDGSLIQNNIDFIDNSSFEVTGKVSYVETNCVTKDVYIKLDGQNVIENGMPVKSDNQGMFTVSVPIGNHYLEVEMPGHEFSVQRFPASGKYNFQDDLAGVHFKDTTLIKVVGRVVGGLREAGKVPAMGRSKNNIGVAKIVFTSQQGNGCSEKAVFTDPITGEYEVMLKPMKYIPSVAVPSNPSIKFENVELLNLSLNPALLTVRDTIFNEEGEVVRIDSVKFHKQLDFIHRTTPQISVKDRDGVHDFIGDSLFYSVHYLTKDTVIRNLRTNPFRWPVFHQDDDDFKYRCLIKVFEQYENHDNVLVLLDSVPTSDGTLYVNNELADIASVEVDMAKVNTPDTLKNLIYTFKPGAPTFLKNASIPEYSLTKKIELYLKTSDDKIIQWQPVASGDVPVGGDAFFRGYLLGGKSDGAQFVTNGPQVPEYVLRDPPGSASFASREKGTTHTETNEWGWSTSGKAHTQDDIYLGAKFNVGLGVTTATEIENNNEAGFSLEISGGHGGTQTVTTTNTKSWSTNDENEVVGSGSDLFVGKSKNVQFGLSEYLALVPDSLSTKCDILGCPYDGFTFVKKYGLSVVPGGYQTSFIYSQNHIENYLIPDLLSLRDKLLQSNDKYASSLDASHPDYGKNNDDPVFGDNVSTTTPEKADFEDLSGLSYTYSPVNLQDSLSGDSVRFVNDQVRKWEEALRLNEWEKINIDNQQVLDSLKNQELDGLWEKYKHKERAYRAFVVLHGVTGVGITYGLIASPLPGTAFAGYATFAVSTATGITMAELYDFHLEYEQKKAAIKERFEKTTPTNYSISGGNTFTSSATHEVASSHTTSIGYTMTASMTLAVSGKVSNNGVGIEKGIELGFTNSNNWSKEKGESETVDFTLSDPDLGDFYSVDVYPSILGWGPVFKKRPGGETSCPFEGEELTHYYKPGTVLSEATLQREKPTLSASPSILTNIPVENSAVFNLTIGNESESGDDQMYDVEFLSSSNPFGAILTIDGKPNTSVVVPAGSSVNKVLSVKKGPGAVYNYDSLIVVVHSQCQYTAGTGDGDDIVAVDTISAHFLPTCTDVALASPEQQWVLNNSFRDTMNVVIDGYDINFFDLEKLKFDYKPSNTAQWVGLQSFWRDTTGMNDPQAVPLPQNTPYTLYDWDVSELVDGTYDIRVSSQCSQVNNSSITYSGVIDRVNPHAFGEPSPADGILEPGDEISIQFNELIDAGALTVDNFDIRGVLNAGTVLHNTSLFFDGINDFAEIEGGANFQKRSFTVEFAAKYKKPGRQAIISQGSSAQESLFIGFDESGHFAFAINGEEVTSNDLFNDDQWHYFAVSYDYQTGQASLFVADENSVQLANNGNQTIFETYEGAGKVILGCNKVANTHWFKGNLHELRVWNSARSMDEFSSMASRLLNGNEPGLLYNWRMDEALGVHVKDHIRRRDAILNGVSWRLEPGGSAVAFDGTNDFIKVKSGDVAVKSMSDFTLEFWFNSAQSNNAVLFSNGTANATSADSITSWCVSKDNAGKLHVKHYGIDYQVTDTNYFDGQWHHFALVMNRLSNLTSYIDGNLQKAFLPGAFKEFSGNGMAMGAHVYMKGNTEKDTLYYSGMMDEMRFWDVARKVKQIRRDMHYRMKGDEPSLRLYMPFEKYSVDPAGIAMLVPTFNEQINHQHHDVNVVGGVTLSDVCPVIKLQRPVEAVAFNYSVNNDKVIITPTTSAAKIENVTLDITAKGIKDLHGNIMESPKTWIAYTDKHQVMWQDDRINIEKALDQPSQFAAVIVNRGGEAAEYSITELPQWLTVEPQSGVVDPDNSQIVQFNVLPQVNIGTYDQDIALHTDFNFDEMLHLHLKVSAPEPDWNVDPEDYQYSMNLTGVVSIEGIESTDTEDMVGAFVDGQCRGVTHLKYIPSSDRYFAFLDIYSNQEVAAGVPAEDVKLRIWNASEGKIHTEVTPEFIFNKDLVMGSPSVPVIISAENILYREMNLNDGWNWISFNLSGDHLSSVNQTLVSLTAQPGDILQGLLGNDLYSSSNGWVGAITNAGGIQLDQTYRLKCSATDNFVIRGKEVEPADYPITLIEGWNWIGFISNKNIEVNQALGNLTPAHGDLLKGQNSFALYDANLGWLGSLEYMQPNRGYMYKAFNDASFVYPKIAGVGAKDVVEHELLDEWKLSPSNYSHTMSVVAAVNLCENVVMDGEWVLAAYVEGEIRGVCRPQYVAQLDEYLSFITLYGNNSGENMTFKAIHLPDLIVVDLQESMIFIDNDIQGSFDMPWLLNADESFDCNTITALTDENSMAPSINVYPTMFNDVIYLDVHQMDVRDMTIALYNGDGRNLMSFSEDVIKKADLPGEGSYTITMDPALARGVYYLQVTTSQNIKVFKIIKVKK